jgi:hypothetical protein
MEEEEEEGGGGQNFICIQDGMGQLKDWYNAFELDKQTNYLWYKCYIAYEFFYSFAAVVAWFVIPHGLVGSSNVSKGQMHGSCIFRSREKLNMKMLI